MGHKLVEQERPQSPQAFAPYSQPIAPNLQQVEEENRQFENFKNVIEKMETREEAEEYTKTSEYKYSIEAKQIIDKKFPKND
jgi:hypothetical protein